MIQFDLSSRIAISRYYVYLLRLSKRFERHFYPRVSRYFKNNYKNIIIKVRGGDFSVDNVIYDNNELFSQYMIFFQRVADYFSRLFADGIEERNHPSKELVDVFWEHYRNWSKYYCATRVKGISDVTKRKIKKIVDKGIAEKWGTKKIADKIRDLGISDSKYRAAKIAITETHTMQSKTMNDMAAGTSAVRTKEWMSAHDERTRPHHYTAGGIFSDSGNPAVVPMAGYFTVAGEPLEYPGDFGASGWNTVMCRCFLLYHTKSVNAVMDNM